MTQDLAALGWAQRDVPGFINHVGPFWLKTEPLRMAMLVEAKHLNPGGVVHGGMISSLLDSALASKVIAESGYKRVATISLTVEFVSGARPGDLLEIEPEIIRVTRSVVFVRGALKCGANVVAVASGVWKNLTEGK